MVKSVPKVRNLMNMYITSIGVVSFSLITLCCSVVRLFDSEHFKMDGHEKTVKQGLNLPVSRFNSLLFFSGSQTQSKEDYGRTAFK